MTNAPQPLGDLPLGYAKSEVGPTFEPAFYKLAELDEVALVDGVAARFVAGGRMMFSFVRLAPGATMPDHSHPHEQLGFVIEGSMRLAIGGDERELTVGDAYAIPGGVPHSATGGPAGCLALDAFSPPREEYLARARQAAGAE